MRMVLRAGLSALMLMIFVPAYAQTAAPASESNPDVVATISREFGPKFEIIGEFPVVVADLDGDGVEDLAVVAKGGNPLMGEGEFHYKVADPYNASFGYGNPKITMSFNTSVESPKYLLIVHSWRATPKAKFVLVNVPMQKISVGRMQLKKRTIGAIEATDSTGVQGAVYWDGKKYRWEVIGAAMD